MQKVHLKLPHLHLTIQRLTRVVAWSLAGLVFVLVLTLGWFSYTAWYVPMHDETIPEDKLSQKREQLRVKDFEDARTQLEAKQKITGATTDNPFE